MTKNFKIIQATENDFFIYNDYIPNNFIYDEYIDYLFFILDNSLAAIVTILTVDSNAMLLPYPINDVDVLPDFSDIDYEECLESELELFIIDSSVSETALLTSAVSYINSNFDTDILVMKNCDNINKIDCELNIAHCFDECMYILMPSDFTFIDIPLPSADFRYEHHMLDDSNSRICVYDKNKCISSALITFDNTQIFLSQVFTLPKYRKNGLARYMLTRSFNDIFSKYDLPILLNVRNNNTSAVFLYDSLNFKCLEKIEYFEFS